MNISGQETGGVSYFSLTAGGSLLALRLAEEFGGTAHLPRCQSLGCGHCTPFDSLAESLPERFRAGDTIICVMAAGIVFRLLAPHLGAKHEDPAVIVINEEGRHVIPLLGGHAAGANRLARDIATFLGTEAAITTASDTRGLTAPDEVARLLELRVPDPEGLRRVTAVLVNGGNVCIEVASDPGIDGYGWVPPGGNLDGYDARLLVTHLADGEGAGAGYPAGATGNGSEDAHEEFLEANSPLSARLVPRAVAAGIGCKRGTPAPLIMEAVGKACAMAGIDPLAVGALVSVDAKADEPGLAEAAEALGVRLAFFPAAELAAVGRPGSDFVMEAVGTPAVAEPAALLAAGEDYELLLAKQSFGPVTVALALCSAQVSGGEHDGGSRFGEAGETVFAGAAGGPIGAEGQGSGGAEPAGGCSACAAAGPEVAAEALPESGGMVLVVGTGAGTAGMLTGEAVAAIGAADIVLGYRTYTDQLRRIFPDKKYISGSMGKELERCREALDLAAQGKIVAMVSSGDPGVYGMAGPVLELAGGVPVHIIPGVTAAQTAASLLGAPLMNDYMTISLSDLLTPREEVIRRARAAAGSGFVVCIYNPTSRKRQPLFEEACGIFLEHRPPDTPVGWVRDAGGPEERCRIIRLDELAGQENDMRTIVIVGNEHTKVIDGRLITRRGYRKDD